MSHDDAREILGDEVYGRDLLRRGLLRLRRLILPSKGILMAGRPLPEFSDLWHLEVTVP